VLKATHSEPVVKKCILESRERSIAKSGIMKVLDKSYPLSIKCGRILTIQACFALVGNSVLNETVTRLVLFQLRSDIVLACWVREVNGVLGRISLGLQRCIFVIRV